MAGKGRVAWFRDHSVDVVLSRKSRHGVLFLFILKRTSMRETFCI
jgi:hypothetical protein